MLNRVVGGCVHPPGSSGAPRAPARRETKMPNKTFLVALVAAVAVTIGVGAGFLSAGKHFQAVEATPGAGQTTAPVTVAHAGPTVLHLVSTTSKSSYVDNRPGG